MSAKKMTNTTERTDGGGLKTAYSDQPLTLFTGPYSCDDSGVSIKISDGNGFRVICKHPILPVRRLRDATTGKFSTEVAFKRGGVWEQKIYPQQVLASSAKIVELSDDMIDITSVNARQMCEFFSTLVQVNYNEIPEGTLISRLGWCENEFSPFLENIVFNGEQACKTIYDAVSNPTGTLEEWVDVMKKVRSERTVMRILLAASFASVILEPCNLSPFFVHIWGTTEVGKTVGLMTAASVWGNPAAGQYIVTFNSTSVAQELVAHFLYNLPMCIDELQIKASQSVKSFDADIYQLTEGHGRLKSDRESKLKPINDWCNCFITSGEQPIIAEHSQGGATNRVIEIEADKPLYSNLVALVGWVQKYYGTAGRAFVDHLKKPGVMDKVRELQESAFSILSKGDTTSKQAAAASAIVAADAIATELFFQDGNEVTIEEIASVLSSKENVDLNVRAYDYVLDLVVRNPAHFTADNYGNYKQEVWGKIDGNIVYIIKSIFDREMQNAGFNGKAFLSWARRTGKLITSTDEKRMTKATRINGNRVWAVCLKIPANDVQDDDEVMQDEIPF